MTRCYREVGVVYVPGGRGSPGISQVALLPELLLQDVTILIEASVNAVHLPGLTDPQLLTHQPDEALVVGHQDDPTLKTQQTLISTPFRLHWLP